MKKHRKNNQKKTPSSDFLLLVLFLLYVIFFFTSLSYLLHLLFPLQGFHRDSHSPDMYIGPDVGVRSLPVSEGRHCRGIHLHHPQQPAGSTRLHHALPSVQTGTDWSAGQILGVSHCD